MAAATDISQVDHSTIIINRRAVFTSALHAVKKECFSFRCKPYIEFSGEDGSDYGGPTREFFRLPLKEIAGGKGLFEGNPKSLVFTASLDALENQTYYLSGRFVGWSIAHGGPGMNCLSQNLFKLMVGLKVTDANALMSYIPDIEIKMKLQKILDIHDHASLTRVVDELGEWAVHHGCYDLSESLDIERRTEVVGKLARYFVFYRNKMASDQFVEGLESISRMWSNVFMKCKDSWKLLCYNPQSVLTRKSFKELYQVQWSESGSNKLQEEKDTIHSFEVYLQNCEDKGDGTLSDLLTFVTGAGHIPPMGFDWKITVEFFDQTPGVMRYPFSSTCSLKMYFPRGVADPDEFKVVMSRALTESYGFGKA